MWYTDPTCDKLISDTWTSSCCSVPSKLQLVADKLSQWEKQEFGSLKHKKKRLLARLEGAQRALENSPLSPFFII